MPQGFGVRGSGFGFRVSGPEVDMACTRAASAQMAACLRARGLLTCVTPRTNDAAPTRPPLDARNPFLACKARLFMELPYLGAGVRDQEVVAGFGVWG